MVRFSLHSLKALSKASILLAAVCSAQDTGDATPGWPRQSFKTEPNLHPPVLETTQSGETAPGLLFIGPGHNGVGPAFPLIMTQDGELVWQGPSLGPTVNNFNLEDYNGESYLHWYEGNYSANDFKHSYGPVHILDHEYREAFRICLPDLNFNTPDNIKYPCYNDFQESQFHPSRNSIIVTAYNVTRTDATAVGGPVDQLTLDAQFYEVDIGTQEILFTWKSLEHLDQLPITWSHYPLTPPNAYGNATEGTSNDTAWDYFHINAVQGLDDGYLVSSRHFWQAVKINLDGSIGWTLYGGPAALDEPFYPERSNFSMLPPEGQFKWQHHFRTPNEGRRSENNTMIVHFENNFNNEVDNGTGPATGLEFELDFNTMKPTVLRRLINESHGVYPLQEGSYFPLPNGNNLVGRGAVPIVEEYSPDNNIVWTGTFGVTNFTHCYRAYKYDNWHATPYYPPKAVAETQSYGQVTVYMSWNGATDVTRWEIFAGPSAGSLQSVGFADKSGFETSFVIPSGGSVEYVQVQAYNGTTALGTSETVKVDQDSSSWSEWHNHTSAGGW